MRTGTSNSGARLLSTLVVAICGSGCAREGVPVTPHQALMRQEPRNGTVSGTVVGPKGSVANVQVLLSPRFQGKPIASGVIVGGLYRGFTCERGRFVICAAPGQYWLYAGMDAATPDLLPLSPLPISIGAGADLTVDLSLAGGLTVTGRLVGPDGESIEGPVLRALSAIENGRVLFYARGVAGRNGYFEIGPFASGLYEIEVEINDGTPGTSDRYRSTTVEVTAGARDVVVRVPRARCVHGTITDSAGRGVAGALVEVVRGSPANLASQSRLRELASELSESGRVLRVLEQVDGRRHNIWLVVSGPDGSYRLSGLPAGEYTLRVTAGTQQCIRQHLRVEESLALNIVVSADR